MLELTDNVYNQRISRDQPKMKLWRYAGFMLTYKCNCACEFCYYRCSPDKGGLMPVDLAISAWQGLKRIAGDSAKVHFTGGEPFLHYDHLLMILNRAQEVQLGPVDMVETNGYWATSDEVVHKRLQQLDNCGVQRLKISCDPFHQAYVDIQLVQRLVEVADNAWGQERVLVRWRDYLYPEADLKDLSRDRQQSEYLDSLDQYGCRYNGRAVDTLATDKANRTLESLDQVTCLQSFLGAKGVHMDPWGNLFSGTCSGIIVGNAKEKTLDEIWREFDPMNMPLVSTLSKQGPVELLRQAIESGHLCPDLFAGKCHVCTEARSFLRKCSDYGPFLGPDACYEV